MSSSSCQPELPIFKLSAMPIASKCAGYSEIGTKFIAIFEGAPPYVLDYIITKQNNSSTTVVEIKREYVDRSRYIFYYLPSSSGEYSYDFHSFGDLHHKYQTTQTAPIKQSVHPPPDAKFDFSLRRVLRTCPGEDISVDVDLCGTGPFELSWTHAGQIYSDKVEGSRYKIMLVPFSRAGHHVVSLVKIEDANDCVKDLDSPDFTIYVRSDRPTVSFDTNGENVRKVEITKDTTTSLSIRLTGERSWFVTYRNVELGDNSKRTERFIDHNASIRVSDIGHYELLKVDDSTCNGDVLKTQYLVQWLDKPTVSNAYDISTMSYGLQRN
ncbi:hypothetical protein EDC94DRAFT_655848 [Helicostylum pulchrum]|nr:hypothetical protein EDC94DRAFT_655848 [Helicostylum pulchrum]